MRGGEGRRDDNEDYIDKDVRWDSGPVKRCRAATSTTLADNHALDDDDFHQDSNENEDYDRDSGGGGRRTIAEGAMARTNLSLTTVMV